MIDSLACRSDMDVPPSSEHPPATRRRDRITGAGRASGSSSGHPDQEGVVDIQELRASVRGPLLQPGDPGYDAARHVWNGAIDRQPALIARCSRCRPTCSRAVNFAREQRAARVRARRRPQRHRQRRLRRRPDDRPVADEGHPRRPGAAHGAGAGRRDVGRARPRDAGLRAGHDRRPISTTGIAGLTLGGGLGWLMRKYGLAVDNLLSADVVTADGRVPHGQRRPRTPICSGACAVAAATSAW